MREIDCISGENSFKCIIDRIEILIAIFFTELHTGQILSCSNRRTHIAHFPAQSHYRTKLFTEGPHGHLHLILRHGRPVRRTTCTIHG